ncbi:hypothetical protein BJ138DRAFT_976195, partial [Hygrophoropsis aurantiaca]
RLNCLVIDELVHNIFGVDVATVDTVNDLRKAIKHKKPSMFRDVEADSPGLWSVSLP